jgi:chromosome segregation ATPase
VPTTDKERAQKALDAATANVDKAREKQVKAEGKVESAQAALDAAKADLAAAEAAVEKAEQVAEYRRQDPFLTADDSDEPVEAEIVDATETEVPPQTAVTTAPEQPALA